jgi:hypothetical protein
MVDLQPYFDLHFLIPNVSPKYCREAIFMKRLLLSPSIKVMIAFLFRDRDSHRFF